MGQHKTNPTAIAVKEGKIQRKKKKRMSRKQIKNELAHAFLDHMMKNKRKDIEMFMRIAGFLFLISIVGLLICSFVAIWIGITVLILKIGGTLILLFLVAWFLTQIEDVEKKG